MTTGTLTGTRVFFDATGTRRERRERTSPYLQVMTRTRRERTGTPRDGNARGGVYKTPRASVGVSERQGGMVAGDPRGDRGRGVTRARNRACDGCGRIYPHGVECPEHPRSPKNRSHAEQRRRSDVVAAWVEQHGWWCPGWNREPHASHDLTAEHLHPRSDGGEHGPLSVLCRSCNSSKGNSARRGEGVAREP